MPQLNWNKAFEVAWRLLVFVVAIGIIIVVSTNWSRWEGGAGWQNTNDAYLQADLTPISAKVAGYLRELPIQDYARVHQGQTLAQLVDEDYRAAVAQAEAGVANAEAQGQGLTAQRELQLANIDAAHAAVAATSALYEQNDRDLARQRRLLESGSSSMEAGEKLATAHAQLGAQLAQVKAQARAAERQLAVFDAQIAQTRAALAAQRAGLVTAKLNVSYTTITAPQDGVIGLRQVKPGQLVGVGTQITTLTPLPKVWVIANYKETQLTHMAVGQRRRDPVDTFPGQRPARPSSRRSRPHRVREFALLPPDNATGQLHQGRAARSR